MTTLPQLKFQWNTPVLVSFKYDPATAFRKEGEFNGSPTVSYTHKVTVNGEDMIFFATEKQHREILAAGCEKDTLYQIVKQEIPGSKSYKFLVGRPGDDSHRDSSINSAPKTPVNAFNASTEGIRPEAAAWAIGKAVDVLGGNGGKGEILSLAKTLLSWQKELMQGDKE